MLRKGCIRYGNTQNDVSFSDAADRIKFKHRWSVASITKRQHVLYTDLIAVWTQFEFLFQKAGKNLIYEFCCIARSYCLGRLSTWY